MEESEILQLFATKQDFLELRQEVKEVKAEIVNFKDSMFTAIDEQTAILRRLDQERVFTTEHIRRIEERVEAAEKDIKTLKVRLAIA